MRALAALRRALTSWYVSVPALIAAGVLVGYFFFFNAFPGRPQVGVIDIPFTVINDRSAFFIGEMLDYARRDDSIKAVVIKLDSPGGGAASSERLFFKTLKLREKKPVVVATESINASGGYLMSMGANYVYTTPTSFVGSVGVIFGPLGEPPPPNERLLSSGPAKLIGASFQTFTGYAEMVKEGFVQLVVAQRGDRLRISPEEVAEARIYLGMEAVRLGLVDAIGSDTDAIEKAASLAGISNYELVDVNEKVFREFLLQLRRIFASSQVDEDELEFADIDRLRRVFQPSGEDGQDGVPPDFPFDVNLPKMYYLYVTPSEEALDPAPLPPGGAGVLRGSELLLLPGKL